MSNTFTSDKDRKDGSITTLNITVPHTSYWHSIRPEDVCFSRSGLPFAVEKVKISGGTGKVTQCEVSMRLTDLEGNTITSKPSGTKFEDYFKVRL